MTFLDDFAVFILTHKRPNQVLTTRALAESGYTGRIYYIVDNLDPCVDEYKHNFGAENVIVFDKLAEAKLTDRYNNDQSLNGVVFARNANFRIAKKLGVKYFLQLDDDYNGFYRRYVKGTKLLAQRIRNLDGICKLFIDYLVATKAKTIAFAQGGDYIGGFQSQPIKKGPLRKVMNCFFCDANKPLDFGGIMNEDVNMYTLGGQRGEFMLTVPTISVTQVATQQQSGGLTDIYLEFGTFTKSFYSVMCSPSCVSVWMFGDPRNGSQIKRAHHRVTQNNAYAKILRE